MDKNAIKKYAVWARRELISRVSQKALQYGIEKDSMVPATADSVNGHVLSASEKKQRQALIAQINEKGFEQVMEEVAYTWFNRFSALRFMEVNGYLPSHVRVFTDDEDNFKPQILTEAIHLELDGLDMEKVYALKEADKTEELFKYLLIVQCNALNSILPGMFQRIEDYTELLLPDNLLREGSVVEQMIAMIPEEDWQDQVQIIGWLYQYYNTEPKDTVFANLKKNIKISKENIPAATQLFTPDWIVRYMVENSLGRLWKERNAGTAKDDYDEYPGDVNEYLLSKWKYYLFDAVQEPEVEAQMVKIRKEYAKLTPSDIKCLDPCCGSGHIIAYMFDVLIQIYEAYGFTTREAVASIVENNIYGLDIDDRAAQLAYFSVMMKARQHDRRFFSRGIQPHVYAIVESNHIDCYALDYYCNGDEKYTKAMNTIIHELHDAKEYGAILNITQQEWSALYDRFDEIFDDIHISRDAAWRELLPLVRVAEAMAQKYDVVVTNPPYMGSSGMSTKLSDYVKRYYPDSKSDLFAVFIERCGGMTKENGYQAMITQHSWMFLSSFEKLRVKVLQNDTVNMAHLGARAFEEIGGEVVQTTSFVMRRSNLVKYKGTYCRLIEPNTQQGKEDMFCVGANRYIALQSSFCKVPGSPVAYWVSDDALSAFERYEKLGKLEMVRGGLTTGDNNRFLRLWFEVETNNISFDTCSMEEAENSNATWFPMAKGGEYRKWYGNMEYVVNWRNNGAEIKYWVTHNPKDPNTTHWSRRLFNTECYFRKVITWSGISSGKPSMRIADNAIFGSGAKAILPKVNEEFYLAFLNSSVALLYLSMLSPTLNYESGHIASLPVASANNAEITELVTTCIECSKGDWDSFETAWDFQVHPLAEPVFRVTAESNLPTCLEDCYAEWDAECNTRFNQLKANEEELNRIFIDIYGLQEELTPEVEDKDVTVRKADLQRDIKSLISYSVGCMFGRYSLDKEGLVYAGGEFEDCYQKDSLVTEDGDTITFGGISLAVSKNYTQVKVNDQWVDCTFPVDGDNIIPICDDGDYFDDDLANRFVKWVETVYGTETLNENLKFIADALGGKGQPKEVIRNYFMNDFYADHCKMYQKRPIYWLFDSGKKNGFKALIYMHRYQPDTIARIRTDYVHEQQARYRTALADLEQRIAGASAGERVKLNKKLKQLQEQAAEIHAYEEKIHHLADQMIRIDLDDGVKHNYELFADVLAKIK